MTLHRRLRQVNLVTAGFRGADDDDYVGDDDDDDDDKDKVGAARAAGAITRSPICVHCSAGRTSEPATYLSE